MIKTGPIVNVGNQAFRLLYRCATGKWGANLIQGSIANCPNPTKAISPNWSPPRGGRGATAESRLTTKLPRRLRHPLVKKIVIPRGALAIASNKKGTITATYDILVLCPKQYSLTEGLKVSSIICDLFFVCIIHTIYIVKLL